MKISSVIRDYVSGIMLLLLASLILGAVSYIASLIPDTIITPGSITTSSAPSGPTYEVIKTSSGFVSFQSISVDLGKTITVDANSVYILAGYFSPGARDITDIGVGANDKNVYLRKSFYNDTVAYAVIPSGTSFNRFFAYFNSGGTYALYLLKAPAGSDPAKVLENYFKSTQQSMPPPTPPPPAISSKLIVNFIGWAAGIALITMALRKFGLPI